LQGFHHTCDIENKERSLQAQVLPLKTRKIHPALFKDGGIDY
jgi:hypothetical protein